MKNVREVKLNNSTRKGTYIYFKDDDNKPRYFKKRPGLPIEQYLSYSKSKMKVKRYGVDFHRNPVKRRKTIKSLISKGVTSVYIPNFDKADNSTLQRAYRSLLMPLVKDKGLLNLLLQDDNLEKIKNRIEIEILVKNEKGNDLALLRTATDKC